MPDTEKALKIATVIIVIFTIIMRAPNQKSFQEGGGHTIYTGAGNPSLPLGGGSPSGSGKTS